MARNFTGAVVCNYVGQPFNAPVQVCGRQAISVPVLIDWINYTQPLGLYPDILGVTVNLAGNNAANPIIDFVRAVKIDNTNSPIPVYVVMGDGDVVTCPPQAIIIIPLFTNSYIATVYAEGLSAAVLPLTKLWFVNVMLAPFLDPALTPVVPQWIGSEQIQRDNLLTPGFGPPALGDQFFHQNGVINNGTNNYPGLWDTPQAAGSFIYLTHLQITLMPIVGTSTPCSLILESTGSAGGLIDFNFIGGGGGGVFFPLCNMGGMNIRLAGDQTWRVRSVGTASWNTPFALTSAFSVNDV